jgi:predicted DNA-binding transcriptional regulator AlpA
MTEETYIGFSDDVVSTVEFAKRAGKSRQWIHKLWKDGKLGFEPIKVGHSLWWREVDVTGWILRHG